MNDFAGSLGAWLACRTAAAPMRAAGYAAS